MNHSKIGCPTPALICETCIVVWQHRTLFSNDGWERETKPLEIVHLDVCGPIRDVVFIKDSISILNNFEMLSKPWWLGWTNLANNMRLMTVKILRSVNSMWKITKLYFKRTNKQIVFFNTSVPRKLQ